MTPRRILLAIAAVALVASAGGVLAGVAVANHQFPDVPTGSPFHGAIDNFANAGCATGFPDGTYRPTEPVLRQQMARFVNACGGRIDFKFGQVNVLSTTFQNLLTLNLTAGALQGGGIGLLHADFNVVTTASTGFPCEIDFDITGIDDDDTFVDLPANTADTFEDAHGSISTMLPMPAGTTETHTVRARISDGCTPNTNIVGSSSAWITYWPFQGNGDGGGESAPVEELVPAHG